MSSHARSIRAISLVGSVLLLTAMCVAPAHMHAQRVSQTPLDSAHAIIPGKDKSPAAAALLGFAPGVGHLYAGEINRGWLIIAIYWTGVAITHNGRTDGVGKVGGVLLLGGLIAGVVDGASAARRYNARLAKLRAAVRDSAATRDAAATRESGDENAMTSDTLACLDSPLAARQLATELADSLARTRVDAAPCN